MDLGIALCKCGIDMSVHEGVDDLDTEEVISPGGHRFDASGTRHRCMEQIHVEGHGFYLCPRPRYHLDEGVPCGPLTGRKLW